MKKNIYILLLWCLPLINTWTQNLDITPIQLSNGKDFRGRTNCIFQDKFGLIWVGNGSGLYRYDGKDIKLYQNNPSNSNSLSSNIVLCIQEDSVGNLWIGTRGGGLNYFNRATGKFKRYLHDEENPASISFNEVYCLKPDEKGNLWIGTDGGGLNYFNIRTQKFEPISNGGDTHAVFGSTKILSIIPASKGKLWIGAFAGGISLFDIATRTAKHIGANTPYNKCDVFSVRKIDHNTLWIGTWGQGLIAYNIKTNVFKIILDQNTSSRIRNISLGKKGEIWATTIDGLFYFPTANASYTLIKNENSNFPQFSTVLSTDAQTVWVGYENGSLGKINLIPKKFHSSLKEYPFTTSSINAVLTNENKQTIYLAVPQGLTQFQPCAHKIRTYPFAWGYHTPLAYFPATNSIICASTYELYEFHTQTGMFQKLKFDKSFPAELRNKEISSLYVPAPQSCWVGGVDVTYLITRNPQTDFWGVSKILYAGSKGSISESHHTSCFLLNKQKILWIGTSGGGLNKLLDAKSAFVYYKQDDTNPHSISNNFVECITSDKTENIWVGTQMGVNKLNVKNGTFKCYKVQDGLTNDRIKAITTDAKNRIWISTLGGISSISKDGNRIRNYDSGDGFPNNIFITKSISIDYWGNIYIGSRKGLVWFHPDSITDNTQLAKPLLVDCWVNSQNILNWDIPLTDKCVEQMTQLTLSHKQNSFSFKMAAIHYFNPSKNKIIYLLDGYDTRWHTANREQIALYKNIPSGKYTFRFKVSNSDGVWNNKEKSICINIEQSRWLSWWAIFLYILFISGCGYYIKQLSKKIRWIDSIKSLDIKHKQKFVRNSVEPSRVDSDSADTLFLQKIISLIVKNIANPDFGVEELSGEMNLSRSQLYRKVHILTGETVTDLIKDVRLKRARQILSQPSAIISEVAYMVGFNDPKYFGKCFKQQFGISPKLYKNKNNAIKEHNLPTTEE